MVTSPYKGLEGGICFKNRGEMVILTHPDIATLVDPLCFAKRVRKKMGLSPQKKPPRMGWLVVLLNLRVNYFTVW